MTSRPRRVELRAFPAGRGLAAGAMRAGRKMAPIHGLFEVDVTEVRYRLRAQHPRPSFTAFVVACVARAAAQHPEVHAYRDWRGRLAVAHYVDVAVQVETPTAAGPVPIGHLVRDADVRDVADISTEIRSVRADPGKSSSGPLSGLVAAAARSPRLVALTLRLMRRSVRLREVCGTVSVSSVGMFAGGGGFGIGIPALLTLNVTVGGMSERARVVDGRIQIRHVLDLTVTVDHNLTDGAPAARFAASLRKLIETADILPHSHGQSAPENADLDTARED